MNQGRFMSFYIHQCSCDMNIVQLGTAEEPSFPSTVVASHNQRGHPCSSMREFAAREREIERTSLPYLRCLVKNSIWEFKASSRAFAMTGSVCLPLTAKP